MYSQVSDSSLPSLFSASSSRLETPTLLNDDHDIDVGYGSGSDTVTDATCTPSTSSSSIVLALLGSQFADNLLSASLSISTLSSCASSAFLGTIPPFTRKSRPLCYSPFVSLTASPFRRSNRRSLSVCPEDLALKTYISVPTPPRLKNLLTEKLYVAGWADKLRPFHTPEHIPWEFSEDDYEPMPWIPEGSLVSKDRFYEIRRQSRPKSYSPPPSPACEDTSPIDPLPFPSLTPESPNKRKVYLKRSASCHPGGSWKIRREALVIDGKVSIDKDRNQNVSFSQLPSSSSEPSNLDMLMKWQKMNALRESGLEALKKSIVRLMKKQQFLNYPGSLSEIRTSRSSFTVSVSSGLDHEDLQLEQAQPILSLPLAVRYWGSAPSTIAMKQDTSHSPLLIPETPTPYPGSSSGSTPVSGSGTRNKSADRISMEASAMCESLRSMLGPAVSSYSSSSPNYLESGGTGLPPGQLFPLDGSALITEEHAETIRQDEWAFAEGLNTTYDRDQFSNFSCPNRDSVLISHQRTRRLSVIPEVLLPTHPEVSSNSATPSHSATSLQQTGIPEIVVSGAAYWDDPQGSLTLTSTSNESLFLSGGAGPECPVMEDHNSDTTRPPDPNEHSPSEDKDSTRKESDVAPSSSVSSPVRLIQGILKPIKTVRFASSASEYVYPAEGFVGVPQSRSPVPKQSSLRRPREHVSEAATDIKPQNEETANGFLQPSRTPKKRFSLIPLSGRLSPLGRVGGAKQSGDTESQSPLPTAKKNPFSMIPVTGRRSPLPPLSAKKLNANNSGESPEHPSTPSLPGDASRKTTAKPTTKSHGSWTSNLRKYGNKKNENEMKKGSPIATNQSVSPAAKQGKSKSPEAKVLKSPSPPAKLASPVKGNRSPTRRALSASDSRYGNQGVAKPDNIIPPRRSAPPSQRVIGKENIRDRSLRDSFERHKIPAHLRSILGRLAG